MFDLSSITLAFRDQSTASESFAIMCADMLAWHHAGEYPANPELIVAIKAGMPHLQLTSAKVYASAILKWSKAGQTPASISLMVNQLPKGHKKSTRGRKAAVKVAEVKAAEGFDLRTYKGAIGSIDGMLAGMMQWIATEKRDTVENALRAARVALVAAKPATK